MTDTHNTALIKKQSIAEVVAHRNRAIDCLLQAYDLMDEANKAFKRAAESKYGISFRNMPDPQYTDNREDCRAWAQKEIDGNVWEYLLGASGLKNLMDVQAIDQFRDQLRNAPPECTIETITATFARLNETKAETFVRGLINVFHKLDHQRYKTNDAFKITPKIILSSILSPMGGFNHWNSKGEQIGDLCRIFHILDAKEPKDHLGDLRSVISAAWTYSTKQPTAETEYFHVRMFKNGNLHITLKRADLVTKANRLIAVHYGQTLAAA